MIELKWDNKDRYSQSRFVWDWGENVVGNLIVITTFYCNTIEQRKEEDSILELENLNWFTSSSIEETNKHSTWQLSWLRLQHSLMKHKSRSSRVCLEALARTCNSLAFDPSF